ncbi:MAG: hypothetical protein ACYTFZ_01560 [Planctomycetota bacterium]|jgi:hypothetical protein
MDWSKAARSLAKCVASLAGAGLLYTVWMAFFIRLAPLEQKVLTGALWLLAPVLTSLGFALPLALIERLGSEDPSSFARTWAWPLVACLAGAAIVFCFGPMLIVFAMFGAATLSVALRKVPRVRPRRQT